MCGIAGLVFTSGQRPEGLDPQSLVQRMIERLRHRGPEAIQIKHFNDETCWLAHARLRVTDNREIADQPFTSKNSRWKIVFNGEIYNWQDLDDYLLPQGWRPRTDCDTERLTEMISVAGIECLHSIDGMFAFGAYDKLTGNLFLARDRFGQKPLYYVVSPNVIAFASELSALMELSPWIPMKVSISGMSQYFRLRYIPAPATAIEPIRKLEPGQYAVINPNGNLILDRFFSPTKAGTLCSNDIDKKTVREINSKPEFRIDQLIKESIEKTVPKDAAVIVSGGIDSSLMAAYTAEIDQEKGWSPSERRGYTVQLEHQPSTEAKWAQLLCKKWGWGHELITLTDRHLINAYTRVSERLDEPLGDRSLLPSWCLAQAIQPHERVAIGGDGGDELFLGYGRYLSAASQLEKAGNRHNWASIYWKNSLPVGDIDAIKKADKGLNISPMKLLFEQLRVLQEEYEHSPLEFLQLLDLISYLPGSVLAKADRTSMDWGLEIRSPLLNTKLALAALSLKPDKLIGGTEMKIVLRKLLKQKAGDIPKGAKQGFGAAIRQGSELEIFLKQRIRRNLNTIMNDSRRSKTFEWLALYTKNTAKWNQNSLFCIGIWTDWQLKISKEFPSITIV